MRTDVKGQRDPQHTYRRAVLLCMVASLFAIATAHAAKPVSFEQARAQRRAFGEKLMATVLADPDRKPVVYALAGLYTGKDVDGANDQLRIALRQARGEKQAMDAATASTEHIKWRMRGWLRIYYLFNNHNPHLAGRLAPDVQAQMEELFFYYGCGKSTVERANLDYIWFIQGSENHDMMDLSNAYLALQAVAKLPAYRNRKLPDGRTPNEHVKAWERYYARYALERARNGLFVEMSPTYGKWFIGEIVNMYEFAEDPRVRRQMEKLLHLTWADWAVDQLNGTRGGGKTRCYQGGYAQQGTRDAWDLMAQDLMGMRGWVWNTHGILSTMALATSKYEVPDIVLDLAWRPKPAEPFVYRSVRSAKLVAKPADAPLEKGYWMDGSGGRMLRYSFVTGECVMGSWMLDTRLDYAAINTQNRWQGVIFATGPNARVFPQSVGLGNGKTYNQHVAVQHRNVMLVANHPRARQTGQMRVFFPNGMRERLIERDGWVIVNESGAWLGVRVLGGDTNTALNYTFKDDKPAKGKANGFWLWPTQDKPPVAMVVSRQSVHKTLGDFAAYLAGHRYTVTDGQVSYTFTDDLGQDTQLALGGKLPVPHVNGQPVNLQPERVFDSPFLTSVHGSGIVTITNGKRTMTLDFNETLQPQQTGAAVGKTISNPTEHERFDAAAAADWQEVFADACTGDWKENWFLDGEVGKVTTSPDGMTLTAGPEFKNDAHHMVLWTKQQFTGDVKIEYDYTRLDDERRCVTILYIEASGSGEAPYAEDISKWNDLRKVPSMKTYFNNMNTYHISYAAFNNSGESDQQYIRGRRYMPHKNGLKGSDLDPDYYPTGVFAPGVKHHITVIKKKRDLYMRIENPQQVYDCHMTNTKLPPVAEGRIGLRHMYTRSARYSDFRVSVPKKP